MIGANAGAAYANRMPVERLDRWVMVLLASVSYLRRCYEVTGTSTERRLA
jgi:hypothetical protein